MYITRIEDLLNLTNLSQSKIIKSIDPGGKLQGCYVWENDKLVVWKNTFGIFSNNDLPEDCYLAPYISDLIQYLSINHELQIGLEENADTRDAYLFLWRHLELIHKTPAEGLISWSSMIDIALEYITITQKFTSIK